MRRVIADSTPLIALSYIGHLDLLRQLYQDIYIPKAVYDEINIKKDAASEALSSALDWIHVVEVDETIDRSMYKARLHTGEVEVIILAQQSPVADLVIIDDNAAKKTAKYLGLTVTGTMGVLLKAKRTGSIQAVAPLLEKMKDNGFYITDTIIKLTLEQAGEI